MTEIATTSGTKNVGLLSVGAYRPERIVTNEEICEKIDSSDEWIYTRTGIKTRRFAADDESAASMATEACRRALGNADLDPSDIDGVILTTNTHFLQTPPAAPMVAAALGANGIFGFDLSAGCAGFGYALGVAADMIRGGGARRMLVVGTEKLSPTMDMYDRGNCFIFADGAAAVVVGETPFQGIGPTVAGSDGQQAHAIRQDIDWITFAQNPSGPRPYVRLEGPSVFRWAAFQMGDVGRRALEAAEVKPDEIDVFVPHQANTRINDLLTKNLQLRPDTVVANDIEHAGNTSAASIPLAIAQLMDTGAAKPGDLALLIGYGAGLTYAAQVVRMPLHSDN
ncbi:ketoacyl-ACP synthase III [Mycobacterium intermedium]|uniref:Mycobacterial beta-ketoacyl-[acyl-carrier-protein] synthase III n=2 Tax=Mycobacterium TaxID=1763 RepID=A0A1E3S8Y3_MYCIE|nr:MULTISPECIES: beta-ketoacyl-ACP synthase III [Mycobacterium]MCV6962224.1 beta-ketoacyl-ACP synthase III [Mycobacterium intermedium]MCV6978047.1 beta-ketoacyl-ACP synthase III [Mycobacterium bourgelatii]ODQ98623.1 3-oxoacyl-ACP synthase [Mycobacterium intermedium]OPE49626.1 ketoacyl-ACP synthase III [Mycobacterium intermedium]ORA99327.1 ketoacyl-ACP synthase III [Mycobacterium intermedium]